MTTVPIVSLTDGADVQRAATVTLDQLAKGQEGVVAGLQPRGGMNAELLRRLSEIGFIPGERVRVIAKGFFGGPPLAVRIGTSTFALRPMEAQSVDVFRVPAAAA